MNPQHTSWDDFFLRREPCWLVVAMKDGSLLGGYFGKRSHASLFPRSGHLYIEEAWQIDQATGEFVGPIPASKGIILRPEDYSYVTVREV